MQTYSLIREIDMGSILTECKQQAVVASSGNCIDSHVGDKCDDAPGAENQCPDITSDWHAATGPSTFVAELRRIFSGLTGF
jgi:hypothetical protein